MLFRSDLAVAQEAEQALDFLVRDRLAKSDAIDIGDGHQHRRVIGNYSKMKKSAGRSKNGFFFDAFYDAEPVVRVDDLVADLECHISPVAGRLW